MNTDYGAKPSTRPKPVLESVYGPPMLWNPVVKFDFQWAGHHPAHQRGRRCVFTMRLAVVVNMSLVQELL